MVDVTAVNHVSSYANFSN